MNRYKQAKQKFKEISNEAYQKQDYLNYMIAEFNVSNILEKVDDGTEFTKMTTNKDLHEVVDKIIENSKKEVKEYSLYFKDVILNYNFIYEKMYIVSELLDKIKAEKTNAEKIGKNEINLYKDNFNELRYEFQSFMQFINKNCICIGQYKEFQMIVNRYFESLLIVFGRSIEMGNSKGDLQCLFEDSDKISIEDIKEIIPYIDLDIWSNYIDNYSRRKIEFTKEVGNYILYSTLELHGKIKVSNDSTYTLFCKYLRLLSFIHINELDYGTLVQLLSCFKISPENSNEMKQILSIIFTNIAGFTEKQAIDICDCINKHIEVVTKNTYKEHYNNFYLYRDIVEKFRMENQNFQIKNDYMKKEFSAIYHIPVNAKLKTTNIAK